MSRDRLKLLLACLVTLAIVAPLGYLWQQSRVPSTYSVMDMGYLDYGGGSQPARPRRSRGHARAPDTAMAARSVADLTERTDRRADEVVELTARKGAGEARGRPQRGRATR